MAYTQATITAKWPSVPRGITVCMTGDYDEISANFAFVRDGLYEESWVARLMRWFRRKFPKSAEVA